MSTLAVFARPPIVGGVKTRLSPALPAPMAAQLYAAMLEDTLETGSAAGFDRRVVLWSDPLPEPFPCDGYESRLQHGADLGERLRAAFEALLPSGPVLVIGSDCPALTTEVLEQGRTALTDTEVVIGPASDGGYWAIGLGQPGVDLFSDMPWSTDVVYTRTLERAAGAGRSVTALPLLHDLDTPDDLARLVARAAVPNADACGPRLRAALILAGLLP